MTGRLTKIAAAMDYLNRAFQEAGLESPEVHVSHHDLTSLRAMSEALHLMYDPKLAGGPDKIAGVIVRAKARTPA